jgi:hypothetical protein
LKTKKSLSDRENTYEISNRLPVEETKLVFSMSVTMAHYLPKGKVTIAHGD